MTTINSLSAIFVPLVGLVFLTIAIVFFLSFHIQKNKIF